MMAYLGYDVNLVQGWVGGVGNQHFWCEVHINGKTYVMETGNEGKTAVGCTSWIHTVTQRNMFSIKRRFHR